MKPKTSKQRKSTRDIDKDTVVAYHDFIQGRIQGELNGVTIGPGYTLSRVALGIVIFGLCCLLVGILLVTLRHKHVYLVDWNSQFLGPFFVILFLMCCSFAVFLLMLAKQRTNQYRKDLAFRPIGDYGVAVVHKSKLTYDDQKKSELKSGTTPHNVRHPQRPGVNDRGDRGNRGDYSRNNKSYDNRGYKDEHDRPLKRDYTPDERDYDRNRRDDRDKRDRDHRDGRRDEPRRERDPNREGGRRGNDPERRRGPDDEERKRRPPPEDFQRGPREGGDRDRPPRRPRPPPGSEEEKRREEGRRRYEAEKRRRYEEDRKRAELRKQAEAESDGHGQERGVDVDATRSYQIQTTVKLTREMHDMNESDL